MADDARPYLSVIIPVYQSSESLEILHERLVSTFQLHQWSFEIIFIDDGSSDGSGEILESLSKRNSKVVVIELARNFGQHQAIAAGLDLASGKWIVVMDCDLQDQPEQIPLMVAEAEGGFDQVVAIRKNRKDSLSKRFGSMAYLKLLSFSTGLTITPGTSNFGVYSSEVVSAINRLKESGRPFGLAALWVGFKRKEIQVPHSARQFGSSSYSLSRLTRLALDGILLTSDRPLRFVLFVGASVTSVVFFGLITLAITSILFSTPPSGWLSVVLAIALLFGVLISAVGMVGLYVGSTFREVQQRPRYIVRRVLPESSLKQDHD